jgi:hypothetical protein
MMTYEKFILSALGILLVTAVTIAILMMKTGGEKTSCVDSNGICKISSDCCGALTCHNKQCFNVDVHSDIYAFYLKTSNKCIGANKAGLIGNISEDQCDWAKWQDSGKSFWFWDIKNELLGVEIKPNGNELTTKQYIGTPVENSNVVLINGLPMKSNAILTRQKTISTPDFKLSVVAEPGGNLVWRKTISLDNRMGTVFTIVTNKGCNAPGKSCNRTCKDKDCISCCAPYNSCDDRNKCVRCYASQKPARINGMTAVCQEVFGMSSKWVLM